MKHRKKYFVYKDAITGWCLKYRKLFRRGVYKRIFGNLVYDNTVVQTLQEEEVNSGCMHASIDRVRMNIIGFGLQHTI